MDKRIIITHTRNYKLYSKDIDVESIDCMIDDTFKCNIVKLRKNDNKTSTRITMLEENKTIHNKTFDCDILNVDIFEYIKHISSINIFESMYNLKD